MVYAAMRERRADARAKRAAELASAGIHDKGYRGPSGAELEKLRTTQASPWPAVPCIRCGAAGACRHRSA